MGIIWIVISAFFLYTLITQFKNKSVLKTSSPNLLNQNIYFR